MVNRSDIDLGWKLLLCLLLAAPWVSAQEEESAAPPEQETEQTDERRVRRLGDVVGGEQQDLDLSVPSDLNVSPAANIPEVRLPSAAQDRTLQELLLNVAYSPQNGAAQQRLTAFLQQQLTEARTQIAGGNLVQAEQILNVLSTLQPDLAGLPAAQTELATTRQVNQTLSSAQTALRADRLIAPPGDNALEYFRQVLVMAPQHPAATAGLGDLRQRLIESAKARAAENDFEAAGELLEAAAGLTGEDDAVETARTEVAALRTTRLAALAAEVNGAINDGRYTEAENAINELIALGLDAADSRQLQQRLEDAKVYGGFKPGQTFSEPFLNANAQGPLMVVIPAGGFAMGSPDNERDRVANEGPQHRVTFERGFAMARTETTVAEFERFIQMTGYRTDAEQKGDSTIYDEGTGRMERRPASWRVDYSGGRAAGELPVVHVSWNDAQAYAAWLSEMTGRRYRLPSEAEFEYVMRAGTTGRYWWGSGEPESAVENLAGERDVSPSKRRWNQNFRRYDDGHWGPAPVATFPANPFGLHDINGNVKEWALDCWHDTYVRAPTDGSAWENPGCTSRIVRGADWTSTPAVSRSAFRTTTSPDTRLGRVGFRVVREL